jgi:hypothetical protein
MIKKYKCVNSEWKSWYQKEASWLEESEEKIEDWLSCSKQMENN